MDRTLRRIKGIFYVSPDADVTNVVVIPRADGTPSSRWIPGGVGFVLPVDDELDRLTSQGESDDEWSASIADMGRAVDRLAEAGLLDDLLSSDAPQERHQAAIALFLSDLHPPEQNT